MAAALGMLDQQHNPLEQDPHDENNYVLGCIGVHNVVLACLLSGVTGLTSAAAVAIQMSASFKWLRFGLMVGVGGGVPSQEHDIRLGDVVVSKPSGTFGGVIQYDFGKTMEKGRFMRTGSLNKPPNVLLTALSNLEAKHLMEDSELSRHITQVVMRYPKMRPQFTHPGKQEDHLYEAEYDHQRDNASCAHCDASRLMDREARSSDAPVVHYGLVASGSQVMKHGGTRDQLRRELDVLCFEMEAAGLMDRFPCLVIRGICGYADSHRNKRWQGYAAATAAAYAKELLSVMPAKQVTCARPLVEVTVGGVADLLIAAPPNSVEPVFSVPFERDDKFVGREDIIFQIKDQLLHRHRVSLSGLGGVGKSQIAIEYAYRFLNDNPQGHVFWVYAANAARFDQAYKDIAWKLKLPHVDDPDTDICELVSNWLTEDDSGHWLMVLDNADDSELFFPPTNPNASSNNVNITKRPLLYYVPRRLNFKRSIIVTTRNRQLGEDLVNGELSIEVLPFAPKEARILLQSRAGGITEGQDGLDFERLLEVLGYIPLAITQAAAFMRRNRMSLQRYLSALEKDEQNIKDHLSTELQDHRRERGIPNSIFRTWKLLFDQIRTQEPRAAAMLSLMAMLDRQQIPKKLLRREDERDVDFSNAIGTLDGLSLINRGAGEETFSMHRLVQLSIHAWLEQHDQKAYYVEEALALLAKSFPNGKYEQRQICESLFPHAQAVLQDHYVTEINTRPRATLLHRISWFDWQQGRYDQSYKTSSEAYKINQELLGQDDLQTLNSLGMLAIVLQSQGKYEAAESMNRQALEGIEKILGTEHPDTLTSISNLAGVLRSQGKYEAAETMNRRVLEGYEKTLGTEHPDTLTSISNLAIVLRSQEKYEAAESMNRRALEGREKILGTDHPHTLTSISNLADVLQSQGKYEAAETIRVKGKREGTEDGAS